MNFLHLPQIQFWLCTVAFFVLFCFATRPNKDGHVGVIDYALSFLLAATLTYLWQPLVTLTGLFVALALVGCILQGVVDFVGIFFSPRWWRS